MVTRLCIQQVIVAAANPAIQQRLNKYLIKESLAIMAVSIVDCFPGLHGIGRWLRTVQEVAPLFYLPLPKSKAISVTKGHKKGDNSNSIMPAFLSVNCTYSCLQHATASCN